jgi:hypothetical protein
MESPKVIFRTSMLPRRSTPARRKHVNDLLETSIDDPDFSVPADLTLVSRAPAGAIDVLLACGEERAFEGISIQPTSPALDVQCVKKGPAMILELSQALSA